MYKLGAELFCTINTYQSTFYYFILKNYERI